MFLSRGSAHYSMDSVLTVQGLPPPPCAPPGPRLLPPELDTVLPPPSQFHTLPRLHKGPAPPHCPGPRCRDLSGSVTSVHSQHKGNNTLGNF